MFLTRSILYLGSLFISTGYGLFLTLPLYIKSLAADESVAGNIIFAGAIGTLSIVATMPRIIQFIPSKYIILIGCLLYSLGALICILPGALSPWFYVASIFLGAGWGTTFTISPILLSNTVTDKERAFYFSVQSAFNAIGTGIGPVAVQQLMAIGISHKTILSGGIYISIIAAILFFIAGSHLHVAKKISKVTVGSIKYIFSSEAIYPCLMVFFGACAFTSVMNFQTTFAISQGFNFSWFYGTYSFAVIFGRFFVSGWISRKNPITMMIVLLISFCIAILTLLIVRHNTLIYIFSSILLGLSYGLVYPLIQAYAVNVSTPEFRENVLIYFTLSYFAALYGFPFVGGKIIVNYGYKTLIIVLFAFAFIELLIAASRLLAKRASKNI